MPHFLNESILTIANILTTADLALTHPFLNTLELQSTCVFADDILYVRRYRCRLLARSLLLKEEIMCRGSLLDLDNDFGA